MRGVVTTFITILIMMMVGFVVTGLLFQTGGTIITNESALYNTWTSFTSILTSAWGLLIIAPIILAATALLAYLRFG